MKTKIQNMTGAGVRFAGVLLATALWSAALAEDPVTLHLTARDGRFYPETLEAPAGTRFSLALKNEGPGAEEFESIELRKEKIIAPGASASIDFAPLQPGVYRFFGDFHPDTAKGQIVVK